MSARTTLRILLAALVVLAPLLGGSGCATVGTQWALGIWGFGDARVMDHGAEARITRGADGVETLYVRGLIGDPDVVHLYRLDRFPKPGGAGIEVAAIVAAGPAWAPRDAVRLPHVNGNSASGPPPGADAIDSSGRIRRGPAVLAVYVPWRQISDAREAFGIVVMPFTIAIDLALIPVYAVAGLGYGAYVLGEEIVD